MVFANRLDRMRRVLKSEYGSADGQIVLVLSMASEGAMTCTMLCDAHSCSKSSFAENELESGYDFVPRCRHSGVRWRLCGSRLISQFPNSLIRSSSDELGVFFRGVLRENDIDPGLIQETSYVVWCLTLITRFGHVRKNTSLLIH